MCYLFISTGLRNETRRPRKDDIRSFALAVASAALLMPIPATAFAQPNDLAEIASNLSDNRTRAQRDAFWRQAKGEHAAVEGRVTDVRPSGWLLPVRVELDTNLRDVKATCSVQSTAETRALNLNIGDRVVCNGELQSYNLLFGVLSFTVGEAEIQ